MPEIIRENLEVSELENYIFTNDPIEFNRDNFKTLWSRFKRSNKALYKNITLYSLGILEQLIYLKEQVLYRSCSLLWGIPP
ncbi:hypothetical protein N9R08_01610 [Flavobacteriaceae bacterium]|nr:hypothetical protein [Flavobacteriaceae bacterium]